MKTVVLIPAYNAEKTLRELVGRLAKNLPGATVLIVDDGSSDSTAQTVQSLNAMLVRHTENRGKGAALQTGFDYLLQNVQFDTVLTMDSDLQHLPEDAPFFYSEMERLESDIVVGWRQRVGTRMPFHRVVSNTLTSRLVGLKTGIQIRDSQCGFRLIRKHVVETIRMQTTGYEAETEFLIRAAKKGFTISFVPVQTVYNNEKSYMRNWQTTVNFLKVLFRT